jgi:hypothetical protein
LERKVFQLNNISLWLLQGGRQYDGELLWRRGPEEEIKSGKLGLSSWLYFQFRENISEHFVNRATFYGIFYLLILRKGPENDIQSGKPGMSSWLYFVIIF